MIDTELFIYIAHGVIYIVLFTLIFKNRKSIKRRYSFHYNGKARQQIKILKEKQTEINNRLKHLEEIKNKQ